VGKRDEDDAFTRRLCRIDGQKPNARDRWKAFHRLWRIANGHGAYQDIQVGESFRVLFGGWRCVRLLDSSDGDGMVNRSHLPKFLRKHLLETYRRQRLYAGHYEWMDRDKKTANLVRDRHGIEVTPTEVAEVRRKVIRLARDTAARLDMKLPADDADVLRLLKPKGAGDAD
jgi:hypothetical protein